MAIYRFGQKIKELFIRGRSIAKVYDHGRLVFSKAEEIVYYTLSINPSPSNATVRLTYDGITTTSKTITVPAGSSVSYAVSATGYTSQSATVVMNSNKNITVTLSKDASAAQWWCYEWSGRLIDAGNTTNATVYAYIPPNTFSGRNVAAAAPSNITTNYTLDIVSNTPYPTYPRMLALYAFKYINSGIYLTIYTIVSGNANSIVIGPEGKDAKYRLTMSRRADLDIY